MSVSKHERCVFPPHTHTHTGVWWLRSRPSLWWFRKLIALCLNDKQKHRWHQSHLFLFEFQCTYISSSSLVGSVWLIVYCCLRPNQSPSLTVSLWDFYTSLHSVIWGSFVSGGGCFIFWALCFFKGDDDLIIFSMFLNNWNLSLL